MVASKNEVSKMASEKVEEWYLGTSYIPRIYSKNFATFAARSFSIVRSIAGDVNFKYVIDWKSPSAYFDIEAGKIAIPGWYLSEEAIREYSDAIDVTEVAVALINGSSTHEALHLAHTPFTMKHAIEMLPAQREKYGDQLVGFAINVIEDLHIEGANKSKLAEWTALKNAVLFFESKLDEAIAAWNGKDANAVNIAVGYKRVELRAKIAEVLSGEAISILNLAASGTVSSWRARVTMAGSFLDLFDAPESKDDDGEGKSDGESNQPIDGAEGELDPETIEKIMKAVEGMSKSEKREIEREFKAEVESEKSEARAEVERKNAVKSVANLHKTMVRKNVEDLRDGASNYYTNSIKASMAGQFAKALKQMRTVIKAHGRAKKSGGNLANGRLYRVAVDGKVFESKSVESRSRNDEVEVGFLVDASGSMNSTSECPSINFAGNPDTLFGAAIAAAKKATDALRESNIAHFVSAHTSIGTYQPVVYDIATFKLGQRDTHNPNRAFEAASRIELVQNYDGLAIEFVTNPKNGYYHNAKASKVLVVISDGEPLSHDYNGAIAIEHTKAMIDNARKAGIKVVSVSLTNEAYRANNRIYGERYNVDARENLDAALVKLVTTIATE